MKKLFRRRLKCSDSALAREERQAVSKEKRAENNVVKNRVEENSVRMLRSLRSERARILGASRVKRFSQVKRSTRSNRKEHKCCARRGLRAFYPSCGGCY